MNRTSFICATCDVERHATAGSRSAREQRCGGCIARSMTAEERAEVKTRAEPAVPHGPCGTSHSPRDLCPADRTAAAAWRPPAEVSAACGGCGATYTAWAVRGSARQVCPACRGVVEDRPRRPRAASPDVDPDDSPIDRFLEALEGRGHTAKKRKHSAGWDATCPVHTDTNPSMSIGEADDGAVLLKCHGCTASHADIVEAVGLTEADLFPRRRGATLRRSSSPAPGFLRGRGT